jgi:hypothetical protein
MRLLVALAVAVVALSTPVSARAGEARLWACHGPDGGALGASFDVFKSAGTFVTPTSSGPCSTSSDSIRVGFTNTTPPEGSFAVLHLSAPVNVRVQGVRIGRGATGPGYFARTATEELEALEEPGTRDGESDYAATGSWVELGLRCASAGCDMTGAALEFRSLAFDVLDDFAPSFTLSGLPAYAAGATQVVVDARDTGIGLASARARLDGVPVGAGALGLAACRDLSPGDARIDLPLSEDCPTSRRITLALDSTLVADGTHRLEVTVTDGAGNADVQGVDLKVVNHPPVTVAPTPTPAPTVTPAPAPVTVPSRAVLTSAKRYRVTRRGALTPELSCPARAAARCTIRLTLRAKLPGRKRTATIASARRSFKPGAKSHVTLKLSAAARRALAKRTLRATLTLAGAKPATVTLVRSARSAGSRSPGPL